MIKISMMKTTKKANRINNRLMKLLACCWDDFTMVQQMIQSLIKNVV